MKPPLSENPACLDLLLELVNIGVGRAASGLSDLTGCEISISVPSQKLLKIGQDAQLSELDGAITLRVSQSFNGGLVGDAMVVLNRLGAVRLAQILLGKTDEDDAFDENEQGAMLELGNIIMGNVVGILASELDSPVNYQLPQLQLSGISSYQDLVSDLAPSCGASILIMRASLSIKEENVSGYLMLMFREAEFQRLLEKLESVAMA